MTRKPIPGKITILFTLCLFSTLAGQHIPGSHAESRQKVAFTSSNLPIIIIDTDGKTIPENQKMTARMGIIDNPGRRNNITDPWNNYDGIIGIEIRGSSGLWKNWPKQQYGLETVDSLGNNRNVTLLGLPAENDWILYPPYSDKSMMRNVLAYRLSNDLGRYASRTCYCEVVLNGDYQGVYVLLERIKRDKNRVAVAELNAGDSAGDQLTGGYIIKVDRIAGEEYAGWTSKYKMTTSFQYPQYQYHYPRPDNITFEQLVYIKQYITEFEDMMNKDDWKDHYQNYFDVDAFTDFRIINELAKNIDSYSLSTFLHKDRDSKNNKLIMGPVWDFNLGFGNADYYTGEDPSGFILERKVTLGDKIPFWLELLEKDKEITTLFFTRWKFLRTNILSNIRLTSLIDAWADTLQEAQIRNFERWPIMGELVWPNYFIGNTYLEETEYLKEWVLSRTAWIDEQADDQLNVDKKSPVSFTITNNYPNPFTSSTTLTVNLDKPCRLNVCFYNILGQIIRDFTREYPSGTSLITFDARGLPSGTCFYTIHAGYKEISGMMQIYR